jgi:tetratricopeptide (TPR) repeat protein
VVAFNLATLHDSLSKYKTLTSEHFILRMDPREAEIYGAEALALLERAHGVLTKKYGLTLTERTVVEIFAEQKDFAIRTFGLPGGVGYLGVCFGRVITANSPAANGSAASWEAVLWHEFAHVITLTMTRNKMPRWLSEGISVYEERQARGNWGERMKPRYRAMILGQDLTPVSKLSGAFMNPKSPAHIGFAYYESSLVVDWLMQRWGLEKMKKLLADLGRGVEINAALAKHFAPIEKLDAEFAAYAQDLAKGVGPKLDWTTPPYAALVDANAAKEWAAANPNNFSALLETAKDHLNSGRWAEAKAPLQKLISLYPEQTNADSAYAMLAQVHRQLGETAAELAMLNKVVALSSNASDACLRLIELAEARKDWKAVIENVDRLAEINPLLPSSYRSAAEAHEALGESTAAIADYRSLLRLEPPNPAEFHYRLARLLHAAGDAGAKREALLALEETPRFRAALDLLLAIEEGKPRKTPKP